MGLHHGIKEAGTDQGGDLRVAVHERLGLVCNYYYSTIRTTQNNYYYYHSYCCCINEAGTDQDGDGQKDEWTNADRRIA